MDGKTDLSSEKTKMLNLLQKIEKPGSAAGARKKIRKLNQDKISEKIDANKTEEVNNDQQTPTAKKPQKKATTNIKRRIEEKSAFFVTLLPDTGTFKEATPILSIDCEMVICNDGEKHLARLTIVNFNRHVVFDEFIKPKLAVKDYITHITNVDSYKLQNAHHYEHFKPKIEHLLKGKIIVGHTLEHDFAAIGFQPEERLVRDISNFSHFRDTKYRISLKALTEKFLNIKIQEGRHSSAEDARAALELYKLYKSEIDGDFKDSYFRELKKTQKLGSSVLNI